MASLGDLSRASERHARGPGRAREQRDRGGGAVGLGPARAQQVDAAELVATDGRHGAAAPDLALTRRAGPHAPPGPAAARRHARGARLHRPRARRQRDHPGPRRLGPDRDPARPHPRGRARGALEGRAGHPHRRSEGRARRAPRAAAPSPRGGRGGLLRRQGPAPAGPHPPRRQPHRAPRALVPRADAPRHRDLHASAPSRGIP